MRKRYSRSYTVLSFLTMFSYREQPSWSPFYNAFERGLNACFKGIFKLVYRQPGGQENGRRNTGTGRTKRTAARTPTHDTERSKKMALDFLKDILGDAYTEDIGARVSEAVGKSVVAKNDFDAKNSELKAARAQLADAAKTIEGLQAEGKDLAAVRREAAEYKARAEQAEKDAAAQLEEYKFSTWWNGQVAAHKGRNADVLRTLAGEERMQALRASANRDAEAKALFEQLQKDSAYAFEDMTPPPPPYAAGTGSGVLLGTAPDGVEASFKAINPDIKL